MTIKLLSAVTAVVLVANTPAQSADAPSAVPVRAALVVREKVPAGRVFIGTVEAARRTIVGSSVSGRVEQIFAEEGDEVDPKSDGGGQIAQLQLTTIQAELAATIADRDVAFHELDELIKGPRKVVVERLNAEVKRAQIRLDNEQLRLERMEKLVEKNSAGQSDLDHIRSARFAAEQTQIIASLLHEEAKLGTRPEQISQAQARLARAEEEVVRYQTRLYEHTVRAPFRGYVISRHIEKGAWVQQGDPVAEIIEVDPVEVRVAVPEAVISRIQQGESVQVQIDAARADDDSTGFYTGTIHRIIPSADSRTRSFPVRVRLRNTFAAGLPVIRPGMLSRVNLPVGARQDALLIPRDALVLDGGRTSIFVVDDSTLKAAAREVPVEIGSAHGTRVQITPLEAGTLRPGMQVITEGNERLKTGQLVSVEQNSAG